MPIVNSKTYNKKEKKTKWIKNQLALKEIKKEKTKKKKERKKRKKKEKKERKNKKKERKKSQRNFVATTDPTKSYMPKSDLYNFISVFPS